MTTAKEAKPSCDRAGCGCPVDEQSVRKGSERYCSEDCAAGRGCGHPGCNCGALG